MIADGLRDSYGPAFLVGERDAYSDRQAGTNRAMPEGNSEAARGYRDGYRPRSVVWAMRKPQAEVAHG